MSLDTSTHAISYGRRVVFLVRMHHDGVSIYNSAGDEALLYVKDAVVILNSHSACVLFDPTSERHIVLANSRIEISPPGPRADSARNTDHLFAAIELLRREWRPWRGTVVFDHDDRPAWAASEWYASAREQIALNLWC